MESIYLNLAILGLVIALFAIFAGQYVKIMADVTINKEVDKARRELKAIIMFSDALKQYNNDAELAIRLSEKALPDLTGVELVQAKSNLAYYYAHGDYAQSKSRALDLSKQTLVQAFLYPDRANNFKINYGYVLMRYADTIPEVNQAIDFLNKTNLIMSLEEAEKEEILEYIEEADQKLKKLLS